MISEQPDQPGHWRLWRSQRRGLAWRQPCSQLYFLTPFLSLLLLMMSGCAAQPSALLRLPAGGAYEPIRVREFPIVEQSTDNPTHAAFQQRAQNAVAAQQSGWQFPGQPAAVDSTNRALIPFGYSLAGNPTPPFSGYALYHNRRLVQRDIAQFWPVLLKEPGAADDKTGADFSLAFVTTRGDKLVASLDGIHPWPAQSQAGPAAGPVPYGAPLALAGTTGSEVSIYMGAGRPSTAALPVGTSAASASTLHPWDRPSSAISLRDDSAHRALQADGRASIDDEGLNRANRYSGVFNGYVIGGQPFFFYTRDGLTHLNYDGRDLLYTYDQVIHGRSGETAIFNPGSTGRLVWFYALRDGLWYYVEASVDP